MQDPTASSPALFGLPPELFDTIIRHIPHPSDETLQALRMTCRQLAYYPTILEVLFAKCIFHRTPEGAKNLQDLNFGKLAPCKRGCFFAISTFHGDDLRDS